MDKFYEILEEEIIKLINTRNIWHKDDILVVFHKASAIAISRYATLKGIDLT